MMQCDHSTRHRKPGIYVMIKIVRTYMIIDIACHCENIRDIANYDDLNWEIDVCDQ